MRRSWTESEKGEKGLQGVPGWNGTRGLKGFAGIKGQKGERGVNGLKGSPGPTTGGVVYTRWGRTTCPSTSGTQTLYAGRVAGSFYHQTGGGANYLCLPEQPQYFTTYSNTIGEPSCMEQSMRLDLDQMVTTMSHVQCVTLQHGKQLL